jgi:hypothetical protein
MGVITYARTNNTHPAIAWPVDANPGVAESRLARVCPPELVRLVVVKEVANAPTPSAQATPAMAKVIRRIAELEPGSAVYLSKRTATRMTSTETAAKDLCATPAVYKGITRFVDPEFEPDVWEGDDDEELFVGGGCAHSVRN